MRYDYPCDYCDKGTVRLRVEDCELIRTSKTDFVVLEKVPIGVCDGCGEKYYHASVLKQAEALQLRTSAKRIRVPVARYVER